jgi:hypothetical protein
LSDKFANSQTHEHEQPDGARDHAWRAMLHIELPPGGDGGAVERSVSARKELIRRGVKAP